MRRTTTPEERNGTADPTIIGRATTVVAEVGAQARSTATDTTAFVATQAPAALAASRGVIEHSLLALRRSSSASLTLGTSLRGRPERRHAPIAGSPPARRAGVPAHPAARWHAAGAWDRRWWGADSQSAHLTPRPRHITRSPRRQAMATRTASVRSFTTSVDIPAESRTKTTRILNQHLADSFDS